MDDREREVGKGEGGGHLKRFGDSPPATSDWAL